MLLQFIQFSSQSQTLKACFWKNQSGAITVYVGLIAFILVGIGALTLDLGRLFVTGTETQSYVDAAALAGAYQLDGQGGARARATEAVNDKLFINQQTLGSLGGGPASNPITISSITFLSDLTGSVVATTDRNAKFVQVTAQSTMIDNALIGVLGGPDTSRAVRSATAGNTQVTCEIPPLMMCNPLETETYKSFSVDKGQQYIAKYTGPGAGMAPGTFGLLDSPTCGSGSKCIAELLAHINPASGCFSTTVDIRPGLANGVREALNTRFDRYENPFFKSKKNDANYHAALNVTKGYIKDSAGKKKKKKKKKGAASPCGNMHLYDPAIDPVPAMAFPKDNCVMDDTCERLGDGVWNKNLYWAVNHPGIMAPADFATMSRYDFYRYEIDNSLIPNNTPDGEDGEPTCNVPAADPSDRRTLVIAVINCIEEDVHGSIDDVEVLTFIKVFLTEPVGKPSSPRVCTNPDPDADPDVDPIYVTCPSAGSGKIEFVVEMISEVFPGDLDGVLHDLVQLYR